LQYINLPNQLYKTYNYVQARS